MLVKLCFQAGNTEQLNQNSYLLLSASKAVSEKKPQVNIQHKGYSLYSFSIPTELQVCLKTIISNLTSHLQREFSVSKYCSNHMSYLNFWSRVELYLVFCIQIQIFKSTAHGKAPVSNTDYQKARKKYEEHMSPDGHWRLFQEQTDRNARTPPCDMTSWQKRQCRQY